MFQLLKIAGAIKKTIGSISAAKIKLKYGAPTDIFPKSNELVINGYSVPKSIAKVVIVINKLFKSKINSFDVME